MKSEETILLLFLFISTRSNRQHPDNKTCLSRFSGNRQSATLWGPVNNTYKNCKLFRSNISVLEKNLPLVAETSKVNMVIIIAATDPKHANKPEDLENQKEITHANQKNYLGRFFFLMTLANITSLKHFVAL